MLTTCIIWPHGGIVMPSFYFQKIPNCSAHPVHLFCLDHIYGTHFGLHPPPLLPPVKKKNQTFINTGNPVPLSQTHYVWRPLTQETSRLHMPPPTPLHIFATICSIFLLFPRPLKIHTVDILPLLYYTRIIYNIVSAEMLQSHRPAQSCKVRHTGSVSLHSLILFFFH